MARSTHLRGYMRRATSMPGQYDRKAARAVSSNSPKIRILFLEAQAELELGEPDQHPRPQRQKHTPRQMERQTWRHTEVKTERERQRQIQGDGNTERQRQTETATDTQAGKGVERYSRAGEGPSDTPRTHTCTRETDRQRIQCRRDHWRENQLSGEN